MLKFAVGGSHLEPPRLLNVEVLRGIASLAVAWFHLTNQYPLDIVRWSGAYGWLGVEAFFVISGFIIPYSLYFANYETKNFFRFMARRALRLEPPYIISILIVILLWRLSAMAPSFAGSAPDYSLLQVILHIGYLIPFTDFNWLSPVYWTLFYEFVFYIGIGLSFTAVVRARLWQIFACFALILLAIGLYSRPPWIVMLFLLGIAGFRYAVGIDRLTTFIAGVLACLSVLYEASGISVMLASVVTLSALVWLQKVRPGKNLLFLGSISYSLYLLHVPIGGRVINIGRRFGDGIAFELGLSLFALIVSILAAALYWYYLERPAHQASKRIAISFNQKKGDVPGAVQFSGSEPTRALSGVDELKVAELGAGANLRNCRLETLLGLLKRGVEKSGK